MTVLPPNSEPAEIRQLRIVADEKLAAYQRARSDLQTALENLPPCPTCGKLATEQ